MSITHDVKKIANLATDILKSNRTSSEVRIHLCPIQKKIRLQQRTVFLLCVITLIDALLKSINIWLLRNNY